MLSKCFFFVFQIVYQGIRFILCEKYIFYENFTIYIIY